MGFEMCQSKGVSFNHVQPHMMYLFVFLCISCVIFYIFVESK